MVETGKHQGMPGINSLEESTTHNPKKVADYECVTKCQFRGKLWQPGEKVRDTFALAKGDEIPRHFKPIPVEAGSDE